MLRRLAPRCPLRPALAGLLAVASLLSLVAASSLPPSDRFYSFSPRFWEFAAGAAVSFSGRTLKRSCHTLPLYALALSTIVLLSFCVDGNSWPNRWTAVVVALTCFLTGYELSLPLPVVEQLGNMSYSLYLYHWPIIQLAEHVTQIMLSFYPIWLVTALVGTAFSSMSYYLVERPIQKARWSRAMTVVVFALCSGIPALVVSVAIYRPQLSSVVVVSSSDLALPATRSEASSGGTAWQGYPWHNDNSYDARELVSKIVIGWDWASPCEPSPWVCKEKRSNTVVLAAAGDSHTTQWAMPLQKYAEQLGVSWAQVTKPRTDPTQEYIFGYKELEPTDWYLSHQNRFVLAHMRYGSGRFYTRDSFRSWVRRWANHSYLLLVTGDPDYSVSVPECILQNRGAAPCRWPKDSVMYHMLPQWLAELIADEPWIAQKTSVVDVNPLFCWDGMCDSHIHNICLMSDSHHMSTAMIKFAEPYMIGLVRTTVIGKLLEAQAGKAKEMEELYAQYTPIALP